MLRFKSFIAAIICAITGYTAQAQVAYTLQLLHASDLEGGVEALDKSKYFAAIIDSLEGTYPNTLILSAGDNYIPGPFYNASGDRSVFRDGKVFNNVYNRHFGTTTYNGLREGNGRSDITIMNLIGFDASAVGNHEFDAGADAFEYIIEEDFRSPAGPASDRWVGAQFPYLSVNLDFSGSSDLGNLYKNRVAENTDFQSGPSHSSTGSTSYHKIAAATYVTKGGEKIGIVGATTPRLEVISSPGQVSVKNPGAGLDEMTDLAKHIQPWIDSLKNNHNINKIVLVTHLQQIQLEEHLATLLKDVDVIVAGGSDAILANAGDRLRSGSTAYKGYPILTKNASGDNVAIVSTDGQYSYVGRLVVGFDAAGKLVPSSVTNTSGPYISDAAMTQTVWGNKDPFADPNGKGALVDSIVKAVKGVVIAKDGNVFGKTDVFLNGERPSVRTQETNFGNISADANLAEAQKVFPNVKVSIKNGGGIRASMGEVKEVSPGVYEFLPPQANPLSGKKEGEISQLDIENALRFNNRLSVIDLSAAGLRQVLEHGVSTWAPGRTEGRFPQIGGAQLSFNPTASAGSRINSLVLVDDQGDITDTIVKDGDLFGDTSRTISIVTLNFLAGGGDGYPYRSLAKKRVDLDTLSAVGNATFTSAGSEQDALAEYLLANHSSKAYKAEDTDVDEDQRIQILSETAEKIFGTKTTLSTNRISVEESVGSFKISVNYTNKSAKNTPISLEVLGGSTATAADFSIAPASANAPAGQSGTIDFTITITDDSDNESAELIFLSIKNDNSNYTEDGDDRTAVVFIRDNDYKGPTASEAIQLIKHTSYAFPSGSSSEILDYDKGSKQLFVTNASQDKFEILDFADPTSITLKKSVDISTYGAINSLAVYDGTVACAIEAANTADNGKIVFFDVNGNFLSSVEAGVLPDMVTFTHDGKKVLTANEGEPNDDYDVDPEGSVTVVDVSGGAKNVTQANVTQINFNAFDADKIQLRKDGVRIFGPNASVSEDLEPEYIAISEDNAQAYVVCQENNAFINIDLSNNTILSIQPLGTKDHSKAGNGFDTDRKSDEIHIAQGPMNGFYMPDAITSYQVNGTNYVLTANEGDARDYKGYSEEERLDPEDYVLDETAFPNAELIYEAFGDMKVTTANGDIDNDGDFDKIYTYGARSFSIFNPITGTLVYDSGDDFEQIVANHPKYHKLFNTNGSKTTIKNRSDDKGPEPEAIVLGELDNKVYAFIGLERTGGVMVYDITDPQNPGFTTLDIPRDTATGDGDLAPEGLKFIDKDDSPVGVNLLVASNEVSSTLTVWEVTEPGVAPLSTQEINTSNALVVYPNPAKSAVWVASKDETIQSVQLMDLAGRIVFETMVDHKPLVNVSVENIAAGTYVLSVQTSKGRVSSSLIVE